MSDGPIDFVSLASALLDRAESLLPSWLPGGVFRGHEYVCADLSGGAGSSLSINTNTGQWADFAGDDKGGDLISLYAAIHNLNNSQAARQLMEMLGVASKQPQSSGRKPLAGRSDPGDERPQPPEEDSRERPRRKSVWRAIVPVPEGLRLEPTFKHWARQDSDRVATWEYALDGKLYGYVVRFQTSDGGKDTLPYTWCVDESDDRGTCRWHWKQWEAPRPLYVPAQTLTLPLPILIVEGEKCAFNGHGELAPWYLMVSWPGGGKAVLMADWQQIAGREVILWPDCDAKRKALNSEERKQGVDPLSKPILPESLQPGFKTMVQLGQHLLSLGCTVRFMDIPAPGDVKDGWDIADMIDEGWTGERLHQHIQSFAKPFTPPSDELRAKVAGSTPSKTGVGAGDEASSWRSHLILSQQGAIKAIRENIVLALDGQTTSSGHVPGIPEVHGLIAFDEFSNEVLKMDHMPWGSGPGKWTEVDELQMGEWLVREHWLPSVPRGTLEEAVAMVAHRHRFHPVRERLQRLKWDGKDRLATWLRRACLEGGEDDAAWNIEDPLPAYLALVGRFFLMGMVGRVMRPGMKFDYMMILEGGQGIGKSTLLKVLAGEFFSDTNLVLGDKDSYQGLQGRWLHEFSELDSLAKADITKIKAFIASVSDYFRASFDRRARDYPRQLVFGGTTNEDHYLSDPTGNRRMWPVRVTRFVDMEWVKENLDQLFAEAVHRFNAGERCYPSPQEERALFEPQQRQRMVESAIEIKVGRYLYEENQRVSVHGENGTLVNEITLVDLLDRIGIGIEKLGPGRYHEKQAAAALRKLGWTEARSSRPPRPWVWRRPKDTPDSLKPMPRASEDKPRHDAGAPPSEGDDACPF